MFQTTKGRVGRLLVAPALACAMLLVLSLQPVAATVRLSNGATASTYVACDPAMARVTITLDIRPESRFSSQSVAVRFYTRPLNGVWSAPSQWLGFRAPVRHTFSFATGNILPMSFRMWAEYAWFDGTRWTYRGEEITTYTLASTHGNSTAAYCLA